MEEETLIEMDKNKRYYALHREECNALRLARYHNKPEVIAKKAERERKKAEKEAKQKAEKEAKQIEKDKKRQEQTLIALATSKKLSKKVEGGLNNFLSGDSPA